MFGEGGTDSKLFVSDLLAAYVKYATLLNLKIDILSDENGHASLKVSGNNVWQAFKNEPGKHVVQRIPPTERDGRRHTSLISVAVLPLPPENKLESLHPDDLDIKFQCAGGPGGQHQNKTASACRITHKPTNLQVFIKGRDQHSNRREALHILSAKVNQFKNNAVLTEYNNNREQQLKGKGTRLGGRGDKVRTYNFINSRVVDHQLGLKTRNIKEFFKGNFKVLFESAEKE